ncbi:MAG: hypothetical protein GY863_23335 [bacterium]|nr:hypothetical protein [bacterium]
MALFFRMFIKKAYIRLQINVIFITVFILLSIFGCSSIRKPQRSNNNITGMTKIFPDGKTYYLVYQIPDYFPVDIPVYRYGSIEKIYVYDEKNMDIILKTRQTFEAITETIKSEGKNKGWVFEDPVPYPEADNNLLTIPLTYNDNVVEIYKFPSVRGLLLNGKRSGSTIECRIIQIPRSGDNYLIQTIRTPR